MSGGGVSARVIAVWAVLAVVVGGIVALESRERAGQRSEAANRQDDRDPRLLVPVAIEQVGAIEVAYSGRVHRFERDAEGTWFYHGMHASQDATHLHRADPAMAQRIETAFQGFGRTRMERRLPAGPDLQQYGLIAPQMVILVYRPKELAPLLQVAVGDLAPDKLSRYVMVVGNSFPVTIANYQIDNLLGLIEAAGESGQGRATLRPS
jgi:hypothetical protein